MRHVLNFSLFLAMVSLVVFNGCASKQTERQVNVLQAQMGVITDELVRLDQSLQDTRSAIHAEENRLRELETQIGKSKTRLGSLRQEEGVIKGIYRTPSGFELPSMSIQQALKRAGYYMGSIDGKIGPQTRKAIKMFQEDHGLEVDGVVGRKTWAKLKVYLDSVK